MWVNETKGTINLSSGSIPILCSVGTIQACILDRKASPGVLQWSHVMAYDDQPAQCHDGLFITYCLGQVGAGKIEAYQ